MWRMCFSLELQTLPEVFSSFLCPRDELRDRQSQGAPSRNHQMQTCCERLVTVWKQLHSSHTSLSPVPHTHNIKPLFSHKSPPSSHLEPIFTLLIHKPLPQALTSFAQVLSAWALGWYRSGLSHSACPHGIPPWEHTMSTCMHMHWMWGESLCTKQRFDLGVQSQASHSHACRAEFDSGSLVWHWLLVLSNSQLCMCQADIRLPIKVFCYCKLHFSLRAHNFLFSQHQTGVGAGGGQNTCNDFRLLLKNKIPELSYQ